MQITSNTTGMLAGLTVATDKDGRDHCVVVIKGTFGVAADGETSLSEEQVPFTYADQHYGDPGKTSIKYECDFAPAKPLADVIVNGHAFSPAGRPVTDLLIGVQIGPLRKVVRAIGDRRWVVGMTGLRPSLPEKFMTMQLVFERAFGGSDHSHSNPRYQGTELRNPTGVGFNTNPDSAAIRDHPLPNFEYPDHLIRSWSDKPMPAGFGCVGRGWLPRIRHAGTYDEKWLASRFPFLPGDFDDRYFLCAPTDQQVAFLRGGEPVRCANMTLQGSWGFTVPRFDLTVTSRFRDRTLTLLPTLDTLVIEPDLGRFIGIWRASILLGRRPHDLREVLVRGNF